MAQITTDRDAALALINRVKDQRLSRNWSQAEIAHRSGLSLAAYKNFETGFGNITLMNLIRLIGVLGYLERFADVVPEADFNDTLTRPPVERPHRKRATAKSSIRRAYY